jgi:hypothetical protein
MSTWVTIGRLEKSDDPVRTFWGLDFTHSGQWNPTEAVDMQVEQMYRSQR